MTLRRPLFSLTTLFIVLASLIVLAGSPASAKALPGDRTGDWSKPIPTKKYPTRPNCWGPLPDKPCEAYDRYNRLLNAYNRPQTRAWAVQYTLAQLGTPTSTNLYTMATRTLNPNRSTCDNRAFWVMSHLIVELYLYDRDIYTTKTWAEPLLAKASLGKIDPLSNRVYSIVLKKTNSKAKAYAAKKAVPTYTLDPHKYLLDAGIGVMGAGVRQNMRNLMQTEMGC